ncbi:Serine/threonine-protein kinase Sgk3 [Acipenser ruthenus]|uniref:Serine/threonine-protein kinase Sgk3 n=1 Tax=Acipenser ruthenus TaxID=7906 RepID=A0A444TW83_ACIRT|nr:Serine/threonine-protein kinase Sgk3 [Acipenser ruthenus]
MDADGCPYVSIPCHNEQRDKKKRYTVYKVMVSVRRHEWFVFRRYAEFDKLYNTLKKQFPNINLKLPAKRIFGDNFDPALPAPSSGSISSTCFRKLSILSYCLLCNVNTTDRQREQITFESCSRFHVHTSVLLAKHKLDNTYYAIKVLQKRVILNRREQKHIMAERNVLLKNIKHPFLVRLHYSFQTTGKLYFVLDFINGGELFFHLQRERTFPEPRARFYIAEMASALGYLHSINIVYRDLKPENILLDSQGHIVLTDFGLCKEGISQDDTTTTFCGTPEYLAPEVLRKQPYDNTVDWWCLGSVLYEMLYGLPPFYSRDTAEMYENILHKPLTVRPGATNAAWSILEGLLEKDRTKRLGSNDDFLEIKRHPFFHAISWDDLVQKKFPPPFNPCVAGPEDIQNFDTEFTEETVPHSVCYTSEQSIVNASVLEADDAFVGFSYAPPSEDSFL